VGFWDRERGDCRDRVKQKQRGGGGGSIFIKEPNEDERPKKLARVTVATIKEKGSANLSTD